MSRPINGSDRGIDGWYQAVEIGPRDYDVRIKQHVAWQSGRYVIARISERIKPEREGGIVVDLMYSGHRQ